MSDSTTSQPSVTMKPFRIAVAESDIDDLRSRLRNTRWPDHVPGSGWTYGADLAAIRGLAEYWAESYDWRRHEAELNEIPQLMATVDGQHFHVLHARSKQADALPLVLAHGWPGSIVEFRHMIGPLVDPVAHGGKAEDAFHVVAPSLPGSRRWKSPNCSRKTCARSSGRCADRRVCASSTRGGSWLAGFLSDPLWPRSGRAGRIRRLRTRRNLCRGTVDR